MFLYNMNTKQGDPIQSLRMGVDVREEVQCYDRIHVEQRFLFFRVSISINYLEIK
ncbi:hypothetical protein D3C84_1310450 [compost metagenome]